MKNKIMWFIKTYNHSLAAFVITAIFTFFGYGFLAFLFVAGFFIGREITQAEYRYIEKYAGHKRANAPIYCGLIPKAWNFDSFFNDMLLPVIVSFATWYFIKDLL
jgi:hypothetical protein